ncbi:hypothetical protein D4Q85_00645 [bacterium]|nr:MAG: hypothetical protein D4Q85_00645 [bacterium]
MVSLLKGILDYFADRKQARIEAGTENIIANFARYESVTHVSRAYDALPEMYKEDARIIAAKDERIAALTAQGVLTAEDEALGMFKPIAAALFGGFADLRETIESQIGTTLESALVPGSPAITEVYENAVGVLVDGILDAMDPGKEKISGDMRNEIKGTMTPLLGLGLTFTVGSTLAELIHPTKEMGFGHISHFLYDTVGFKSLMQAYIDPLRLNLIAQPTKYSINQLTKPFIPPWPDALEWYGRGHIDEDEMRDLREKHGIEDGWDYRYTRMGTKPSSYFMLNAIAKEGYWDADDFRFWLSDAGYGAFQITDTLLTPYEKKYKLKPPHTTQIDFLLDAYKHMNLRSTVGDERSIRKSLMIDGWLSRKDFEADLAQYKITAADAKDILDAIDMQQARKDAKELQKAYEKKFNYGRMTEDELKTALTELKLREGYVVSRTKYLATVKEGKLTVEGDEKTLTKAETIAAYKDGRKQKGWAIKQIDDIGYTVEDAALLVEGVDQDVKNDTTTEWVRAYEQRTLNLRMTPEELGTKLIELGRDENWVEARVAYIAERVLGKEKAEE